VLGSKLRNELFPAESPLGKRVRVGETVFLVIGVLAPLGDFLGFDLDDAVYMPVERAMKLLNLNGMTSIDLEARVPELVDRLVEEAKACLVERHGREDFTIVAQDKALAVLDELVASLGYALAGIAAVSLLVAGVGIMNMQLVAVLDRTGEIGLRIAVGALRRDIMLQFFMEATLLAGSGAVMGWALAKLVVTGAGFVFPDFPLVIPGWASLTTIGAAAAVGAAFGLLPARRAARRSPIEALRHE
jgi:putative ABC transport system permease protein